MRVLAMAMLCALGGCSMFMHSIERPKATVRGAQLQAAGPAGVSGQLQVDVMNPNNFGVPLSGLDWQLSIGGARAVTGSVSLSQTIPARGVVPITTSLTVATGDAIAVAQAIAGGARDYELDGTLHFATPVGQLDVDVHYRGTLSGGGLFGSL